MLMGSHADGIDYVAEQKGHTIQSFLSEYTSWVKKIKDQYMRERAAAVASVLEKVEQEKRDGK